MDMPEDIDLTKSPIYAGHAVTYWLRNYATNWKVVGSIPNGVIF
jgi:hypothetical protein